MLTEQDFRDAIRSDDFEPITDLEAARACHALHAKEVEELMDDVMAMRDSIRSWNHKCDTYRAALELIISETTGYNQLEMIDIAKQALSGDGGNGWVSVEDRLPESSGEYWVVVNGESYLANYSVMLCLWESTDGEDVEGSITHWYAVPPLPPLPTDKNGEG